MTDRRPARDQELPLHLASPLQTLQNTPLYAYCRDLYQAGWTLRAIGDACVPQRPRSTVRSWILKLGSDVNQTPSPSPVPIDAPVLKTASEYVPKRTPSPGISPTDFYQISVLAPIARKYRSGMSPKHRATIANQDLTNHVMKLYDDGVTVQELATAAGVTYRAMARRLGRTR